MKKDVVISFTELMNELDSFRTRSHSRIVLTKEQKQFINKCRNHTNPVSYSVMAELWAKAGWGKINKSTVRDLYLKNLNS